MEFDEEYYYFTLRNEVEHFLSIDSYLEWYASKDFEMAPELVVSLMKDGCIYSYEMITDSGGFRIKIDTPNGPVEQIISGVSFVRHGYELSCCLLAGESPPLHNYVEVAEILKSGKKRPGKEEIEPGENYGEKDRFLPGYPGFCKVIVLGRFDLRDGKYDVRYVNVDEGSSFIVFTDDPEVLHDAAELRGDGKIVNHDSNPERYQDLFSSLSCLIYLPAFVSRGLRVVNTISVATQLSAEADKREIKEIVRSIGKENCIFKRTINFIPDDSEGSLGSNLEIQPPEMRFESKGKWKYLGPHDLGEDKDGDPILGRTWVSTKDSWSEVRLKSYLVSKPNIDFSGEDPGEIYIQVSPAYKEDVYKIGLTRRSSE